MITFLEKNNLLSWIVVVLIAVFIFAISSIPFESGFIGNSSNYKAILYHFFAFFSLALFLAIAITKGKKVNSIHFAIFIAIVYAILDEIHQLFVPGRYGSLTDVLINCIGILSAIVFYLYRLKYSKYL